MTEDRMALLELLRNGEEPVAGDGGDEDCLRRSLRWLLGQLMEVEVSAQIGAERSERTAERTALRNGTRTRPSDTRVGTLERKIPKLRTGSYFPSFLEPRRRAEQAPLAVVAEAYVQGVSTGKVEALIQTLGISGIAKSEVSRLCASLDAQVEAFRTRRLDDEYRYVWLDARDEHVRDEGRVQSMAVVVAYGVRADGRREVLGMEVTSGEHAVYWRTFLQRLVARGGRGVRLVVSDAHPGLKQAIREVFVGAAWQRCPRSGGDGHFMRNLLARVPKQAQAMVAATVRSIFQQPDRAAAQTQLGTVIEALGDRFPKVVELLIEAAEEVFAFDDFPAEHRRQLASTNPLERLNKELKRRSAARSAGDGGIFPNRPAAVRLLGAVLSEQHEEWLVGRHSFSETSMRRLVSPADELAVAQLETPAA